MKNDKVILDLQKQIKEKETKLKSTEKFTPITNCSLELDGIRYNLHIAAKEQLQLALIKLSLYNSASGDLGLNDFIISGFSIDDWITDIKVKLSILDRANEKSRLELLRNKLQTLLSNDKRVELEIEEIARLID